MNKKPQISKGFILEEVLRAYFLRAGFFVVRGVPFRFSGEDLTDIDLWLYECPTGTSRRVQICDIKYKQRPKAVERIFWTSGLVDALYADGAYVATTDKRKSIRSIAEKLSLQLIDGNDLARIQDRQNVLFEDRISEEQLIQELTVVDKEGHNKNLQNTRIDILSSLSEDFGAASAVRALEKFAYLSEIVISCHPNSNAACATSRLAYMAAAIVCQSLDYVSIDAAFRSLEERRALILDAVRLGALSDEEGQQTLKLAIRLVEKYSPGGRATAIAVENGLKRSFEEIPAEIVADQAMRLLPSNQLFVTGRELEKVSYSKSLPIFDSLSIHAKSMVGALLDYARINRERFAKAWHPDAAISDDAGTISCSIAESETQKGLFEER